MPAWGPPRQGTPRGAARSGARGSSAPRCARRKIKHCLELLPAGLSGLAQTCLRRTPLVPCGWVKWLWLPRGHPHRVTHVPTAVARSWLPLSQPRSPPWLCWDPSASSTGPAQGGQPVWAFLPSLPTPLRCAMAARLAVVLFLLLWQLREEPKVPTGRDSAAAVLRTTTSVLHWTGCPAPCCPRRGLVWASVPWLFGFLT